MRTCNCGVRRERCDPYIHHIRIIYLSLLLLHILLNEECYLLYAGQARAPNATNNKSKIEFNRNLKHLLYLLFCEVVASATQKVKERQSNADFGGADAKCEWRWIRRTSGKLIIIKHNLCQYENVKLFVIVHIYIYSLFAVGGGGGGSDVGLDFLRYWHQFQFYFYAFRVLFHIVDNKIEKLKNYPHWHWRFDVNTRVVHLCDSRCACFAFARKLIKYADHVQSPNCFLIFLFFFSYRNRNWNWGGAR